MAALRSGVSSCSPGGAAKTRFKTPPCSEANCVSIRSVAFCVSEPGISNWSRRCPPKKHRQQEGKEGQDAHQQHTPRVVRAPYAPTGRARRLKVARRPVSSGFRSIRSDSRSCLSGQGCNCSRRQQYGSPPDDGSVIRTYRRTPEITGIPECGRFPRRSSSFRRTHPVLVQLLAPVAERLCEGLRRP